VGFLDALRGRSQPVRANLDALFALPSAAVTLETAAGLVSSGNAGICWKPPASQSAEDVQREITELLGIGDAGDASSTTPAASLPTMTQQEDSYGYRWLLLEDPAIDDLVTRVHMVNTSLTEAGWGPQLLCSVFSFVPGPEAGPEQKSIFLVYLYKRGTFYPFAPLTGERRDSALELQIKGAVSGDLKMEQDLSRWFPVWGAPGL
jgi:hypothetical protein